MPGLLCGEFAPAKAPSPGDVEGGETLEGAFWPAAHHPHRTGTLGPWPQSCGWFCYYPHVQGSKLGFRKGKCSGQGLSA